MRLGSLRLVHRREIDEGVPVVGPRELSLIVHLELGITGGTALAPRMAALPSFVTRSAIPEHHVVAALSRTAVKATLPAPIRRAVLSDTPRDADNPEWLPSP